MADVAPRECVALYEHVPAGELEPAREVYQRLLPLARFDMTPKLVQYFKAAQDEAGLAGGPCREPRLPLTTGEREDAAGRARGAARGRPRVRAARYLAAVDSHTEGMPTRVVTGGVGPIPGATMLERKLHFEAEMDDLRLLLMREPRGHSAMSGAILQPPTRPDADWGVLFIEVSGCLPMCGHGTIGVATVLVETGMVEVTEPETRGRARHAGRARAGARGGRGRARDGGHAAQRARRSCSPATPPSRSTGSARDLRHGLRRELLRAASRPPRPASTSIRRARTS